MPSAHSDCFTTGVSFKKSEGRRGRGILWCLLPVFMSMYDRTEMSIFFFFYFLNSIIKCRSGLGRRESDGARMRKRKGVTFPF